MNSKNKKTILITGAGGMLGSVLTSSLSKKFKIVASYHLNSGRLDSKKDIEKINLDVTSLASIKKVRRSPIRIDAIVHCAAITEVNICELDKKKSYAVNAIGTRNMVSLARHYGADLIYISTPMVFSGLKGDYKETSRPRPLNYYAKTKLMGEKEVLKYRRGLVLRANPIGIRPPNAHPNFIQWFVKMAKNNFSFDLFSDVVINPISVNYLSKIIAKLIITFKPGILHVGSADVVNKADIWPYIISNFRNYTGKVSTVPVNKTKTAKIAKRPKNMTLSVKKAEDMGLKMPSWKSQVLEVIKALI